MKISLAPRILAVALAAAFPGGLHAADSINFSTFYNFNFAVGAQPYGGLLAASDGKLYGTTSSGNVIYSYTPGASAPVVLHTLLSSEGSQPSAGLAEGTAGTLVGTAIYGGANAMGSIYKVDASTGTTTVLHSATNAEPNLFSTRPLYASDSMVYVTSPISGMNGVNDHGGIVTVALDGTGFSVIHLATSTEGQPSGGLIEGTDSRLYGVTSNGGDAVLHNGSIYAINKNGTGYVTLHAFTTTEGVSPKGELLLAVDGFLYGTTTSGGANGKGTIYRLSTDGTSFQKIYDFDGTKGAQPQVGVVQGSDGFLYGTTLTGGDDNLGVVFRVDRGGFRYQVLHSLTTGDGTSPYSPLTMVSNGVFYAATVNGGTSSVGTLFRLTVTPETTFLPPVVKVNGPKRRSTTNTHITLRGKVTDPDGSLPHVEVKVNGHSYRNAKGVVKWQYDANLKLGRNVIKIRAISPGGSRSPVQRVVVYRYPVF
jgi:uncharacterized repeat protein (TIGR03803 family)